MVSLILIAGCARQPSALLDKAIRAEAEAKRAFEKQDVQGADLAAARAEDALETLKHLRDNRELNTPAQRTLFEKANAAALSARNFSQLAHEDQQRRELLASLKLKAYQSVRGMLCTYGLGAPALAAEQLARAGSNSTSTAEQSLASIAWRLVQLAGARPSQTNGAPDWAGVAADLRAWSNRPPPAVSLFVALAFGVSGWTDFALSEIDSVDPALISSTNTRLAYHLQRCALLALHGWDRSAARELDAAFQLSPEGWQGFGRPQALALFHLWLAEHALQRGQHEQANLELAEATRQWPESPLAALVRGEQLAASGRWSEAADFLESQAQATRNERLGGRLRQRAREFREKQGAAPPLLGDVTALVELLTLSLGDAAQNTTAVLRIAQFVADAKTFGARLADKLPEVGSENK